MEDIKKKQKNKISLTEKFTVLTVQENRGNKGKTVNLKTDQQNNNQDKRLRGGKTPPSPTRREKTKV